MRVQDIAKGATVLLSLAGVSAAIPPIPEYPMEIVCEILYYECIIGENTKACLAWLKYCDDSSVMLWRLNDSEFACDARWYASREAAGHSAPLRGPVKATMRSNAGAMGVHRPFLVSFTPTARQLVVEFNDRKITKQGMMVPAL